MQRNLLADGLSDDGFLCNDVVLETWPVPRDEVPTTDGGSVKFISLIKAMEEALLEDDPEQALSDIR